MSRRLPVVAVLLVLAFAYLGSRGIWDPDEGRYTNVAINMLARGDWLIPHRSLEVAHWTKPPLAYWTIASSLALFGTNTWAARLTPALAYLACAWLVGRIARRLAPGGERAATLVFATMLLPAFAAQIVTTDFLLTACETLAMWGYVEFRWGDGRRGWALLMWGAFGLAFLAKGPPGLLPLLAVLAMEFAAPGPRRVASIAGLLVFAGVALPWFIAVVVREPSLASYFLAREVVDRVAGSDLRRHPQWYGWLLVYVPTLLLGTLPWTFALLRRQCRQPARMRGWRDPAVRQGDSTALLLIAWIVLPLMVFCVARSRLPLYVLPLMVPLSLLVARQHVAMQRVQSQVLLLGWVAVLVVSRLAVASLGASQDARPWADAIRQQAPGRVDEVVFIDAAPRYGLRLHLGPEVELVALAVPRAGDTPSEAGPFDEPLASELQEDPRYTVWVAPAREWPSVSAYLAARGFDARVSHFRDATLFVIRPKGGPDIAKARAVGPPAPVFIARRSAR